MKSAVVLLAALFFISGGCFALALADDDDLGGAKRPVPDMSLKREGQFKRVHQLALRYILLQRFDEAERFLNDYLMGHPSDAETHYMLGVLEAQRERPQEAVASLQRAIDAGLPAERIVAGPREVMVSLEATEFLQSMKRRFAALPVQGPLLGNVTDASASFWVRLAHDVPFEVRAVPCRELDERRPPLDLSSLEGVLSTEPVRAEAMRDFTCVATLAGLQPDTEYAYQPVIDGHPCSISEEWRFRTFPERGTPMSFALAFGGGAGYVPENERMWSTIDSFDPRLLLLLGDNVYIDDPESPVMQHYTYQRRQARPEWRTLTAHTPVFSIWDDHDFSVNDSWGGPGVELPRWKIEYSWPIFQQNWANPPYESGEIPGCWYAFSVGDVDFIMLDCRYYRTDPESEHPTMLGPSQLAWLKETLSRLTGTFKVICSSVPFDYRTKGDSLDTWSGYRAERDEIFGFLEEHEVQGVVLMSADRHRSDAWRIDRAGSYPLYEFNSSRLTNQHVHQTMEKAGARFSYNAKQSFGLVEFDTSAADPTVKYTVVTIDGERVHDLTVRRSELE